MKFKITKADSWVSEFEADTKEEVEAVLKYASHTLSWKRGQDDTDYVIEEIGVACSTERSYDIHTDTFSDELSDQDKNEAILEDLDSDSDRTKLWADYYHAVYQLGYAGKLWEFALLEENFNEATD